MISGREQQAIVRCIRNCPELSGGRVVMYSNGICRELDAGQSPSKNYSSVMVMVEEVTVSSALVTADTMRWSDIQGGSPPGAVNPLVITNGSRLGPELAGMGIACTATFIAAGTVAAASAATVPTAGASAFILVTAWVAAGLAAVQCGDAIARVGIAVAKPDGQDISKIDDNDFYKCYSFVIDAADVALALVSLPATVKSLIKLFKTQRVWAARGLTDAKLKSMNRAERAIVIREMMDEANKTPEGREIVQKAVEAAKVSAKTLSRTTLSVKTAQQIRGKLAADVYQRLLVSIAVEVRNLSLGPIASAMPYSLVGSASGSVNWLIHIMDGTEGN